MKLFPSVDRKKGMDWVLALLVLVLTGFGLIFIYDASVVLASRDFNDPLFFLKNQLVWVLAGVVLGAVVSQIDYHFWQKTGKIWLVITFVCLILVLIPALSQETYGARRRLNLPFSLPVVGTVGFQPSEMAKFTLIIYLASFLTKVSSQIKKTKSLRQNFLNTFITRFLPFVAILGIAVLLIMKEPDLGTSMVLSFSALLLYVFSGAGMVESLTLIFGGAVLGLSFILLSEYRQVRFFSFLNPEANKLIEGYHINQSLIALGSGGLFGVGLGASRQKFQYLPEVTTDSIIAVVGEELGFLGTMLVVLLLLFIVYRGLLVVKKAKDKYGQLLSFGIISIIMIQSFLNLGSMLALIPLTGVPLPFVSYGGSNMLILLLGVGVLLNISKR